MLEPVLPASPAPGACSPCLACLGDQKGLEVCLKMKPLWASVFMMLAMFLQSSKEKAQRYWVRGMILTGVGASSESHAGPVSLPVHVLCPKDLAVMWRDCRVPSLSICHLHPRMTQCCTKMVPCPRPEGWGHPCPTRASPWCLPMPTEQSLTSGRWLGWEATATPGAGLW